MQGFTILELMVTLTIAAVILSLAVPSFTSAIRNSRVLTASNSLAAAVANARSEAVKRGRMVSVCPSSNGTACSADWSAGWIVYLEQDTVTAGSAPNIDEVLFVGEEMKGATATQTDGGNAWVRFSSRGIGEKVTTLEIKPSTCDPGNAYQDIEIGLVGRITFTKQTCS